LTLTALRRRPDNSAPTTASCQAAIAPLAEISSGQLARSACTTCTLSAGLADRVARSDVDADAAPDVPAWAWADDDCD